ncbi:MAG TPA: hypothetical protein VJR89_25900 [Polyangiales bacterium]|nr:hypothetical protein [Polyangiales bacterium]
MRSLNVECIGFCLLLLGTAASCQRFEGHSRKDSRAEGEDAAVDATEPEVDDEPEPDAPKRARAGSPAADVPPPVAGSGGRKMERQEPPSVAQTPAVIPTGTAAQCEAALEPPSAPCFAMDEAEPNDKRAPAMLQVTPNCGYIAANMAANDDDAYAFSPEKSDPVRVQLAYTTADVPDLEFSIIAPDGQTLTTQRSSRKAPREDIASIFQATAGARYVLQAVATSGRAVCQSYALRVDPYWCTDSFEDNDLVERATKLSWNADEVATAEGTLSSGDSDFFEVMTTRGDPVLFTGEYRAAAGEEIIVRRTVYDATGSSVVDQVGDRDTDREMFSYWLKASSQGTVFRAKLWPSGSGCAPYKVSFEAAACTDEYEDNDTAAMAAKLPIATDVEVTGFSGDPDFYRIDSLAGGGSCVLRYEVPVGRSQQLRVQVFNTAGKEVTNGLGGELVGNVRQLRVTWAADRAGTLIKVQPDNGGYCQSYTIRCDLPMGQ